MSSHISDVKNFAGGLVDDIAVALAGDGALIEGHDVLRERSSFVGEDVLYLAELLVERGCAGPGVGVGRLEVHLLVPVDEERLDKSNDLDADVKTDGHDGI